MDSKAGFVAFLGLSLVLADSWKSGTIQDLAKGQIVTGKGPWYNQPWGRIGYMTAGVLVATFIASVSDGIAKILIALFIGLWIVWLIIFFSGKAAVPGTQMVPGPAGPASYKSPRNAPTGA